MSGALQHLQKQQQKRGRQVPRRADVEGGIVAYIAPKNRCLYIGVQEGSGGRLGIGVAALRIGVV